MPTRAEPLHEPVLTLHVRGRAMLRAVAAATAAAAEQLGMTDDDADRAGQAVAALGDVVATTCFDDPEAAELDVRVEAGPGSVRVVVDDQGLPFTALPVDTTAGPLLATADVVRVQQRAEGHRVELVVRSALPAPPAPLVEADPAEPVVGAADVAASEVVVRDLQPGDEEALARLIWRVYGYTYVADYLYHPDRVRQLRERGWLHAGVAVLDDEIVGLGALVVEHLGDRVADWTLAATDPRVRGHGILGKVGAHTARTAADLGIVATFAEAVTEHTITQRGAVESGAVETAVLLGFIPEHMRYRGFADHPPTSRQSAVLSFRVLVPTDERTVHLPPRYADELRGFYDRGGLRRVERPGETPVGATRVHAEVEAARDLTTIEVERCGADAVELVARHTQHALAHGAELVYCELSLADPGTPHVVEGLRSHGFSWAGLIPELRGDVLRLQYLDFEPDTAIIQLYSDEARRLLELALADRP